MKTGMFYTRPKVVQHRDENNKVKGSHTFTEGIVENGKVIKVMVDPVRDENGIEYRAALCQIEPGYNRLFKVATEGADDPLAKVINNDLLGAIVNVTGVVNTGSGGSKHIRLRAVEDLKIVVPAPKKEAPSEPQNSGQSA